MKKEIWKDIPGYEGRYQASSLGRIRSLLNFHDKGKYLVLSQRLNTNKYLFVLLYKDGGRKFIGVHRLVCLAFHENPNNLPCVNHKDENPLNNCADNLEWCTHKYNSNYGTRNKRISDSCDKKPIVQFTHNGEFVCEHDSIKNAAESCCVGTGVIWACCNGMIHESRGYLWFYADDPRISEKIKDFSTFSMRHSIIQFSLDGREIAIYKNGVDASNKTGVDQSCILKCAKRKRKSAGGYIWKYADKNK